MIKNVLARLRALERRVPAAQFGRLLADLRECHSSGDTEGTHEALVAIRVIWLGMSPEQRPPIEDLISAFPVEIAEPIFQRLERYYEKQLTKESEFDGYE